MNKFIKIINNCGCALENGKIYPVLSIEKVDIGDDEDEEVFADHITTLDDDGDKYGFYDTYLEFEYVNYVEEFLQEFKKLQEKYGIDTINFHESILKSL